MSLHHTDDEKCPLCESKLAMAHASMAAWFRLAKAIWRNVHVSWSFRSEEAQNRAYEDGQSLLRWPHSKHNHTIDGKPCALALDVFQIDDDGVARFSPKFYNMLWEWTQKEGFKLKWGGLFKKLGDAGHFELNEESI